MSPTQRTLKALRDDGSIVGIVEKWNPYAKIRQDLFGFVDLVAIQGSQLVMIQTTSGVNHIARCVKSKSNATLARLLATGTIFEVWSWSKKGARGERKLWMPRVTQFRLEKGKARAV